MSGMCVGVCIGMCVGDVCQRVYGHVWQCEGMSGCYYCIYMSHIFARQQVGGGVVKRVSFKSISTWFKPHCDHFLKIFLVLEV